MTWRHLSQNEEEMSSKFLLKNFSNLFRSSFGTAVVNNNPDERIDLFTVVTTVQKLVSVKDKRKVAKKLLSKDTESLGGSQVENLRRGNKEMVSLPSDEYIDFLRDLRDILNWHKDYFLSKMSVFYLNKTQEKK
jgi:hypothetical protein